MNNVVTTSPGIPARQLNGTAPEARPAKPLPTRGRRPGLIAAAVLLIVGFALSGAVLVSRAGETSEVLVASRAVPAGHIIGSADVSVIRLSGSVRAIAAAELRTVVGRTAATGLVGGQVLNRDMLTTATIPGPGKAMIGLALKPGQLPNDGIGVGDKVLAVVIPAANDPAPAAAATALTVGEIYSLRAGQAGSADTLVTLIVPLDMAGKILAQSAAGRLGLVKVGVTG